MQNIRIFGFCFSLCFGVMSAFCPSYGDDMAAYNEGKKFADGLAKSVDSKQAVAFQAEHNIGDVNALPEAQLRFSELEEKAVHETYSSDNKVGTTLLDTQKTVLEYDYRPEGIIDKSNNYVKDPLSIIGGKLSVSQKKSHVQETTHTCEESAVHSQHVCVRERILVPPKVVKKTKEIKFWYQAFAPNINLELNLFKDTKLQGSLHHEEGNPRAKDIHAGVITKFPAELIPCVKNVTLKSAPSPHSQFITMSITPTGVFHIHYKKWRTSYDFLISTPLYASAIVEYEVTEFEDNEKTDTIHDQCQAYEAMTEKGLCRYGDLRVIEGPGTRTVQYDDKEIKVYRDWWKREYTYVCKPSSKNNCDPFRKQGCDQIKSVCLKREGGLCVNNQKTFRCQTKTPGFDVNGFTGDVPFCLDGNCDDHSWTANKDFADVMSKMSILKEMQKDMDAENATVFKGNAHQCNKDVMGFQDCCQGGGWGDSIGIAKKCDVKEEELRVLKDKKKCVHVGTYCSQKEAGICTREMQSYCCFGSKLSKIVHEQGRKQLGIGWGHVENPNCRAFTVEEVTSLDFSQLDLSDLFEDLKAATNEKAIDASAKQMNARWGVKIKSADSVKQQSKETLNDKYTKRYFGVEDPDNASL